MGGPGNRSRINLESLCEEVFAEGLNEEDIATTEVEVFYALYHVLFLNKVKDEPEIKHMFELGFENFIIL